VRAAYLIELGGPEVIQVGDRLARGGLRPRGVRTLGLAETAEAHRQVADRVRGRLVIHPWR
jgi:NADPH:quinone reductase-like Zn-dependent oxidoreductase